MKDKIIKLLGGYTKSDVLTEVVKDLYNSIGSDDILTEISPAEWRYKDKTLGPAQQKALIAEATVFLSGKLWDILKDDIKYQSNKKMFVNSASNEDLVAGKLWLLTLDAIDTRLKSLAKGRGTFNS